MQTLQFSLFTFASFNTADEIERSGKNYEKYTKEVGNEKVIDGSMYCYAVNCGMCDSRIGSR